MNEAPLEYEKEPVEDNRSMKDEPLDWIEEFRILFEHKVTAYKNGIRDSAAMFSQPEEVFLRSIGATPQEIFDFVEDWCDDGVPDPDTSSRATGPIS
jgi:hypothetical protein